MEFNNNQPIYLQIVNKIKEEFVNGTRLPGEKMPSVREFSKVLKVNPTTIQRVYKELELEELTYTKRGMGSFVTEDKEMFIKMKKDIADQLTMDFIEKMSHIGIDKEQLIKFVDDKLSKEEKND
jgi:DNA-binding transcriptional regulator YhcF (GntR family)